MDSHFRGNDREGSTGLPRRFAPRNDSGGLDGKNFVLVKF